MRKASIERKTSETFVKAGLNLDGTGQASLSTGVGFLDHMLNLFAAFSGYDLSVSCQGDTFVDDHHSVEDVGIAMGQAFLAAIGDRRGIERFSSLAIPMDEALVLVSVDISGRGFLGYDLSIPAQKVGTFDTELVQEFFAAFCREAKVTLHLKQFSGVNSHHIIEAAFKGFGRVLGKASAVHEDSADKIPSTKGVL